VLQWERGSCGSVADTVRARYAMTAASAGNGTGCEVGIALKGDAQGRRAVDGTPAGAAHVVGG